MGLQCPHPSSKGREHLMVAPPKPKRIALSQAVDLFIDAMSARQTVGELSPRTVENYARDLAHLVSTLGGDTVTDDITGEDIDSALLAFSRLPDARRKNPSKRGKSAATQVRYHQSVNRFFSHAEKHQWVQMSPMRWADLRPRNREELRTGRTALTAEQALAVLRHGPTPVVDGKRSHEQNSERDAFLVALLIVTGPRVSELAAADDDDFSVSDGQLQWRTVGKGGKARVIPLSDELDRLRRAYLDVRPSPSESHPDDVRADALKSTFRSGRGLRMSPRDIQRLMHKVHQRVTHYEPEQAREITPHALRHTAATLMLAKGWDVKVVAEMLGHESISTTGIYLDSIPGELARAVADSSALSALTAERRDVSPGADPGTS